mmetsp:Transcript_63861/g.169047  ORF Transcript_63861/g.169047 Transcript_63861/m.169047 type:complete len:316 (+) Transcript_63861:590-1537(+)
MSAPTSVSVDDDFSSRQTSVSLRSTDDELSGRVDVQMYCGIVQCHRWLPILEDNFLECLPDHLLFDQLVHISHAGSRLFGTRIPRNLLASNGLQRLRVLGGDDDSVDFPGLHGSVSPLHVFDRHLSLTVWAQPPKITILSHVRQFLSQTSCHRVCERHGVLSLITRIPEHDALVTSTDVKIILADVHTACNVRTLLVDADQYLAVLVIQSLAVNAAQVVSERVKPDVLHNASHDGLVVNFPSNSDLSCNHDHVVLHASLTCDLAFGIAREASIEHCVGNLVADFVRVTFVHRLRRKEEYAFSLRRHDTASTTTIS